MLFPAVDISGTKFLPVFNPLIFHFNKKHHTYFNSSYAPCHQIQKFNSILIRIRASYRGQNDGTTEGMTSQISKGGGALG